MLTPQAKRRRLNEASKTLHKPFKSPFRTPLRSDPLSSDPPSSDAPEPCTAQVPSPVSVAVTPTVRPVQRIQGNRPVQTTLRPPQKTSPSITREIVQLRSDIQVLSQAYALSTSSKDERLVELIDTWRTASRAAAEELFAGTRDRVNRMGGVAAWRDREKQQRDLRKQWDREELEAEREKREEEREDNGGDQEEYERFDEREVVAEEKEEQEDFGNGDDSFTMDMMLKTLNVDLALIGYNKEAQRWDG